MEHVGSRSARFRYSGRRFQTFLICQPVPAGALSGQAAVLAVGFLASGVVGYLAVAGLIRYLAHHPIDLFAYYRLVVAAALLVWLLAS